MERNPYYSMKTLLEFCESCFCKEIGGKIFALQKDEVMMNIFDVGWGRKSRLFGDEEKLSG